MGCKQPQADVCVGSHGLVLVWAHFHLSGCHRAVSETSIFRLSSKKLCLTWEKLGTLLALGWRFSVPWPAQGAWTTGEGQAAKSSMLLCSWSESGERQAAGGTAGPSPGQWAAQDQPGSDLWEWGGGWQMWAEAWWRHLEKEEHFSSARLSFNHHSITFSARKKHPALTKPMAFCSIRLVPETIGQLIRAGHPGDADSARLHQCWGTAQRSPPGMPCSQ